MGSQAELRIGNCADGYLMDDPSYRQWVGEMRQFISSMLGPSPRSHIFAYRRGNASWLAFDLEAKDNDPNNRKTLSITILLSGNDAYLEYPATDQLDIVLPGVVDALNFVALVLLPGEPMLWSENSLLVLPMDTPSA